MADAPDTAAIDAAVNAKLDEATKALTTENADLKGQVDSLQAQLSGAIGERDQVAGQLAEARTSIDTLTADRDAAGAKIRDLENAASISTVPQGRKMRATRVLVVDQNDDKEVAAYGRALKAAIDGECEIVFSDGKSEIRGLEPIKVSGPVWQKAPAGYVLNKPIGLVGPAAGQSPYTIVGFALFDDEGDQVAWSQLPEPIQVMPNGRTEIRQSIIF